MLCESEAWGRRGGGCRGFQHGERNLYCLDAKAGMFWHGRERDGVFTSDHFLALHGGDLIGRQLETLRNGEYFVLRDPKPIEHIRKRETSGIDFLFGGSKIHPRGKVLCKVGPVIRLVCDVRLRK